MDCERDRLHAALVDAFSQYAPIIGATFERRAGYLFFACASVPVPLFNTVWFEDDSAANELEEAVAELDALGLPASVQVNPGRSPAAEATARRLGFTAETALPGMVLEPADFRPREADGLVVERVEGDDVLAAASEVAHRGYEVPDGLFEPLYVPAILELPGLSLLVGRADGEPVATAIGFVRDGAVGIFNVGTPPAHRGKGYGAAVTSRAVADGLAAGADFAYLQSSPLAEPVYRRLGFRRVETYLLLTRPAG